MMPLACMLLPSVNTVDEGVVLFHAAEDVCGSGLTKVPNGAVRLVTDFSGLETPSMALKEFNYDVELTAVCDLKPDARASGLDRGELQPHCHRT